MNIYASSSSCHPGSLEEAIRDDTAFLPLG